MVCLAKNKNKNKKRKTQILKREIGTEISDGAIGKLEVDGGQKNLKILPALGVYFMRLPHTTLRPQKI